MNLFNISSIFVVISSFGIATLVFYRGRKKRANVIFSCIASSIGLWGLGASVFSIIPKSNPDAAMFWWRIAYSGTIFVPVFYSHFIFSFFKLDRKILIRLTYFLGLLLLFFNLFKPDLFLGNLRFVFNQFYWHDWNKNKNFLFAFLYIGFYWILLLYSFLLLIKAYLNSTGLIRQQLKYFIIGSMVGWLGPHGFYLIDFGLNVYPVSNFFIAMYPLIIGYGIVRYRLMDVSLAITRAGIFIVIYSLVLGIPFALAFGWKRVLSDTLGSIWWIVPLASSTLLATAGPFIYLYFDRKAENALLKEQRGYQNILRNASSGMIRIKDLSRLLNLIVHVVTKTVKIRNAAIYLFDKDNNSYVLQAIRGDGVTKQVEKTVDAGSPLVWTMTYRRGFIVTDEEIMRLNDEPDNISLLKLNEQLLTLKADLVVPSFVDERLIGFIVLGEKLSKKLYSQDDMNVFSVLANQAALAIENAQFYDEIKQTHEQLFQAEKLATIGTMADGLSHQINNRFHALSLISGDALDIINTSDLVNVSPEVKQLVTDLKDALQKIQNNVLQGGEVVKGLLKYSRPGESGFEPIDFKDVLKGALDMVQYKIKLVEIDLLEKIVPDLPKVHGNLTQLQEVFFNLIDNAYDATRERKTTLKEKDYKGRIEVIARVNEKNNIEINVIDNGMGIKDLDKKKMFTPFFTTKATAKKGTGLGLYVIKKIVSAHNGIISVGSTYEKGTHFVIEFPLSHEVPVKTI